jgi:hypothetical protein
VLSAARTRWSRRCDKPRRKRSSLTAATTLSATSRACSLARPCGSWRRWSFGCLGGGVCWLILASEAVGGWLSRVAGEGGRVEAMSEASPPLTASHRPPSQPNEPAHSLAQAEQHLGFRIVVQGSAIQAAGGRRREAGDGIRERGYPMNDACSPTRWGRRGWCRVASKGGGRGAQQTRAARTQADAASGARRSNPEPEPAARRQQPAPRTPAITTHAFA